MLNLNFTVIGMSETWLYDANVHCFGIESYNHLFQYRKERRGGGVSLFIHKKLSAKCREDLNVNQSFMEAIFVEIPKDEIGTNKCIIVGTIYRPPNQDVSIFTDSLTEILHNIRKEGKLLYIMGDFNINLLDTDNHITSSEFLDNMYSLSFFPSYYKAYQNNTEHLYLNRQYIH